MYVHLKFRFQSEEQLYKIYFYFYYASIHVFVGWWSSSNEHVYAGIIIYLIAV
jgi:ABC-type multidrug transport system permease subunit